MNGSVEGTDQACHGSVPFYGNVEKQRRAARRSVLAFSVLSSVLRDRSIRWHRAGFARARFIAFSRLYSQRTKKKKEEIKLTTRHWISRCVLRGKPRYGIFTGKGNRR